jgi:hypothetical protein
MIELKEEIKRMVLSELAALREEAVSPKQASHLALYVQRDANDMRCILYDTEILKTLYQAHTKFYNTPDMETIRSTQLHESIPNPVFGMIRVEMSDEYDAWVVQNSAAEKGYGPLMYDIAFSFAGEKGMTPDRHSIRPAAKNVWKHLFLKRSGEFDITPLKYSNKNDSFRYSKRSEVEQHSYGNDEERYLDSKYVWKQSNRKDLGPMFQKNRQLLNMLKSTTEINKVDPEQFLVVLARIFFREKYSPSSLYW